MQIKKLNNAYQSVHFKLHVCYSVKYLLRKEKEQFRVLYMTVINNATYLQYNTCAVSIFKTMFTSGENLLISYF
jgi:hypothetical protein